MNRREVKKAPVLRFKGFTNDWEQHKLGDETNRIKSYSISHGFEVAEDTGTKYIHYGDIHTSKVKIINNIDVLPNIKDNNYKPLKYGDVIVADASEDYKGIADACIVNTISDSYKIVAGLHTIAFRPKSKLCSKFLYFYLSTDIFKHFGYKTGTGLKVFGISYKELAKFKLKEPSVTEQKKIVKLLFLIENAINLQQRKVKMLVLLKKEISNYYFSPSYLSRSCKENSFKEIFTVVTDYVANGSFKSLRENVKTNTKQGYAYMIRLQDASNNWKGPWLYTDKSGYNFLKKSKIYPGDIVMSNVGSVGKIIRIPKLSKPMTLAPNAILLRSTKYDNDFLYELLKSDYGKNKIKRMTTPGVQNKINKTDFKKIKVHLPNSQEQKRISCLLTNMNILIHEVKSNISQKQKLKQFLLQNMFI
ncbi:restriction endonuclease subunit S [Lactobacillus amylovorus]|uniref:restriction endonuclease subunit S n=1 Tax=Lactobacillus amylovorus TaxID=1604 RepID=UPI003F8BB17A